MYGNIIGGLNCTIWKVSLAWMNVRCRELSVNFVDGSCGTIRPLYPLYERGGDEIGINIVDCFVILEKNIIFAGGNLIEQ